VTTADAPLPGQDSHQYAADLGRKKSEIFGKSEKQNWTAKPNHLREKGIQGLVGSLGIIRQRKRLSPHSNCHGRHLGRVLEMAESSATKWEYEAKLAKRFGFAQQPELPMPMPVMQKEEAAN
jgi:hypothetical protein